MIFISKYLIPKNFVGIALYPFIFLKNEALKRDTCIVNHERIHLKQQQELLVVFFYLFYVIEWFFKWVKYNDRKIAYRNISFEREAYNNESDFRYLKNRKRWAFIAYM